jgi:uncharacterized protein (DUF4415 family)
MNCIYRVRYEWDERKNHRTSASMAESRSNWQPLVFQDERCLFGLDLVDETGKVRWHALGAVSIEPGVEDVLFVVHVYRGGTTMAKRSSASSARAGLTKMTTEDIRNRKWTDAEKRAIQHASEARKSGLDLPESEYRDIPRLTEDQLSHLVRLRGAKRKVAVSVRLDPQVLDWLRAKGTGHLTRINDILTNLMEAERRTGSGR